MQTEILTQPETSTIYRVYQWSENIADWKCLAGYYDQAEALKAYAEKVHLKHTYKLTKDTTQTLLVTGE
tara:strand:+ start:579 stop:785 length:207 start_codon:yes stop_codon:yes gene_type:complete